MYGKFFHHKITHKCSRTFSEMKFKDFLKTFLGENYIFQALWNRYLPYHKKKVREPCENWLMTSKNNRTPLDVTSSFVHYFIAICEFKLELQFGNVQFVQSHQIDYCNLLCNLVWGWAAVLQTHLQHLKENVGLICVPDYVYMAR